MGNDRYAGELDRSFATDSAHDSTYARAGKVPTTARLGPPPLNAPRVIEQAASSGSVALPGDARLRFESCLGTDLGGVRVHVGDESAAAAQAMGARAYTTGQDIHFSAGQYDPSSAAGMHLLAHEVAHTVQQQGASAPAMQHQLEVSRPGDRHEREAESFADAFVAGAATPRLAPVSPGVVSRAVIQREQLESSGESYPQAESRVYSTLGAGVAMDNPHGVCIGVDRERADWVHAQMAALDELVAAADWPTARATALNEAVLVLEPAANHLARMYTTRPPYLDAPAGLDAETVEAMKAMLSQRTADVLSDGASWNAATRATPGGRVSWLLRSNLARLDIIPPDAGEHRYRLERNGGGRISGGALLSVEAEDVSYDVVYEGPRGGWRVTVLCGAGGIRLSLGTDALGLPISLDALLPASYETAPRTEYLHSSYFDTESFYASGDLGANASLVAAGAEVITIGELVFTSSGAGIDTSTVGTSTFSAEVGAGGRAGACGESMDASSQGPGPIPHVELPEHERAPEGWYPFFRTTIGFETDSAELDGGDRLVLDEIVARMLDERLVPLFDAAGGLDVRVLVDGGASGRWNGADSAEEADANNHELGRLRGLVTRDRILRTIGSVDDHGLRVVVEEQRDLGSEPAREALGDPAYLEDNSPQFRTATVVVEVRLCGAAPEGL